MRTKTKERLEINAINYQRNGVSGEGFYILDTFFHQKNKTSHLLITLTPEDATQTRAVTLGDITEGWRGDYLFNTVMEELGISIRAKITSDAFYRVIEKRLA